MSEGLMTEAELNERFGSENEVDLTIEKYERLKNPCNWDKVRGNTHGNHFSSDTCPLCKKHGFPGGDCRKCPLPNCTGGNASLYHPVRDAARASDRDAFIIACDAMLTKLHEIKEENELEDVEVTEVHYANIYARDYGELKIGGLWKLEKTAQEMAGPDVVAKAVKVECTTKFKMKKSRR